MTDVNTLRTELDTAVRLPDGDGKVSELERLVTHADAAGDVRLGFDTRFALIDAYANHTERWKMLPAFGWCLAAFDKDPSLFSSYDAEMLRWFHKWAVTTLRATPRVGLPQTMAALDDMERRYQAGGHSLHAVYNLRARIADHIGDRQEAQRWFDQWRAARRDENSDCAGCDPGMQCDLLTEWGRYDEAVEVIEPVLSGVIGCVDQPEKALAGVLLPYLRLGRYEEAAAAHVRAYRRHRYERDAFAFISYHLLFCAMTSNIDRGLSILEEHLGWLDRPYDDYSAMEFAAAGALVAKLGAERGIERLITRPAFENRAAGEFTPEQLESQLRATALDLATQFDARNGTSHQSERIHNWLMTQPLMDNLELPPDDPESDALAEIVLPPEGRQDVLVPLSTESIAAIISDRGDRYAVQPDGAVVGRWGEAVMSFTCAGSSGELLHIRAIPERRFMPERITELLEFCNGWNHDRLLPKAYVHDTGEGSLLVAGEVSTDLEHGVAAGQLAAIIATSISACAALADSLDQLL